MKNSFISLSVSALIAAAMLPVSVSLIASVTVMAGVMAIAFRDYASEVKPLTLGGIPAGTARRTHLRLAA